jgi:hypothetical protein
MVFSRMILSFIVFKWNLLDPMKIQAIIYMPPPKNHNRFEYSMG